MECVGGGGQKGIWGLGLESMMLLTGCVFHVME